MQCSHNLIESYTVKHGNPRKSKDSRCQKCDRFHSHTRRNPLSVKKSVYKKYDCEADNSSNQEIYCNFCSPFLHNCSYFFLLFLIICPFIHTLFHSFIYFGIYRTRHRQFLPNAWRYKKNRSGIPFPNLFFISYNEILISLSVR